jgi:hypothetical protein
VFRRHGPKAVYFFEIVILFVLWLSRSSTPQEQMAQRVRGEGTGMSVKERYLLRAQREPSRCQMPVGPVEVVSILYTLLWILILSVEMGNWISLMTQTVTPSDEGRTINQPSRDLSNRSTTHTYVVAPFSLLRDPSPFD